MKKWENIKRKIEGERERDKTTSEDIRSSPDALE